MRSSIGIRDSKQIHDEEDSPTEKPPSTILKKNERTDTTLILNLLYLYEHGLVRLFCFTAYQPFSGHLTPN